MRFAILAAIAAMIIIVFSCSNERGGFIDRLMRGGGSGVPVTVESVVGREQTQTITLQGEIEPTESATVSLPEDATIERVMVAEGDAVNAGDPLLRISEEDLSARVARVRSDLRDVQNRLDKNSYLLRNRDRLLDEERIDRAQYDSVESDVKSDEVEVEKLKQEAGRLETKLGDLIVKSPMAGIITKRSIAPGGVARAGEAIIAISKTDPAAVMFRMAAEDSAMMHTGMTIRVRTPNMPQAGVQAKVTSIDPQISPDDKKFAVHASLPNPQAIFKSGMKVEVSFDGPATQKLYLIPDEALIREPRGYFVFTVEKGVARKIQVIPSQSRDNYIEITRGLKDDDVVVTKGQDKITDGTAVDIWGK